MALLLLVALLLGGLLAATGTRPPGVSITGVVLERLVCSVRLTEDCRDEPELGRAYGEEVAHLLRAHAPALLYEDGMRALPVDYRRCRADACAEGDGDGVVVRSGQGERTVAFTHAIDCRRGGRPRGADCSGERAGKLYLSYWFYYPGSATGEGSTLLKRPIREASARLGKPTYHRDDWESYQVRIGPNGRFARASSHHGYSYELGGDRLVPGYRFDTSRGRPRVLRAPSVENGWGPDVGTLYISGGSHAGNARVYRRVARLTKDHRLRLVPIDRLIRAGGTEFEVTPPWMKRVFFDPEYSGTD
ncbi:MAG: hypothetical protein M3M99_08230 [Actinomycetota bacterium]|nr:hypothetical protein [Actinomycetota bacterium]